MQNIMLILLIISGAAFIIQTIAGFLGGFDDFDSDGEGLFGFFTVRNAVAFLLGYSSAGYLLLRDGHSQLLATLAGLGFGFALSASVVVLVKALKKLEQTNQIEDYEYRGLFANVTVKIPPLRAANGKVELVIKGRIDERLAVTDDEEEIAKGTQIQVVRTLDNGVLLVHKLYIN